MTGADAMTRPPAANGAARMPRDFTVLLPPGWVRIKLDGLLMDLAARGGHVTGTEIAGGPAIRHQYEVLPPEGSLPGGQEPVSTRVTMVDFFLPLPGQPGLLVLSFSTPVEPLAKALVMLFDAIAESLRWTR